MYKTDLTEQGLNSPSYSDKSLREQAAGMAYAWNKYKNLASIEVFDYHNWVDNRDEGGLHIGLRRFPTMQTSRWAKADLVRPSSNGNGAGGGSDGLCQTDHRHSGLIGNSL